MSTIRVNTIQSTSTTDGGISIDSSGHVTLDGQNLPSAGPLSNRNLIINGAMQVAQRGTSVTGVTTSGHRTVDRFRPSMGTLGTWTIEQSTDAPDGFAYSHKFTCTTADASPAANDDIECEYKVEAQDLQHLNYGSSTAQDMTLSFWVKSNKTGTATVNILQIDNSNKSLSPTYTISSAGVWEHKTIFIPGDTAGVINNDNGLGLYFAWWLNSGSTYTSGTNRTTWTTFSSADRNASNLGVGGAVNDYWQITGVQLEVGSVATPFEHRSYGDELARCRRYYQRFTATSPSTATATCSAFMYTSTAVIGVFQSQVQMRAIPTLDSSSGTNHYGIFRNGTYDSFNSVSISSTCSENCFVFANTTEVSGTAGQAGWLFLDISTAYLGFSAEL